MSTVPLAHPGSRTPPTVLAAVRTPRERAPILLAAALLLVLLYAAFEHGAVALASEARMQVAIAALVATAGSAALWTRELSFRASRAGAAGAALLLAFALWSGITLLWSVAPNQTWIEFNRGMTYALVLGLAILLGSWSDRAPQLIGDGFLIIALAITAYALGQKVLPGLHVTGFFDLNQTASFPRLQEPLGYWNALALFIAYGAPLALVRSSKPGASRRARNLGLVGLEAMLVTIGLTYSRGGLIALAVGLCVVTVLSGARLRLLMWLSVAVVGAIPPLVFGLADHSLSSGNVSLGSREGAGAILLAILLASIALSLLGAQKLRALEQERQLGPQGQARVKRGLLSVAVIAIVAALLAVSLSSRGLTGTFSHAWTSFTTTRVTSNTDPQRLLSTNSENRWVWWKEAAGAFSDKPIAGWGAGSFPVVHLLYRRDALQVNQPHSVPLQFLSETGLVGTVLALLAFALLLRAAVTRVRTAEPGEARLLMAALLGSGVMFLVHSLYDWDWDIPAMTLPALVFIGVLCARRSGGQASGSGYLARGAGVAAIAFCACLLAVSFTLPSVSASKAAHALVEAGGSQTDAVNAQATAELAARLDPLSDAGLLVQATIAAGRDQLLRVRSLLLSATRRDPSDESAWFHLTVAELSLGDRKAAAAAGQRALALDPLGSKPGAPPPSPALTQTPPQDSATAQPARGS